MAWSESIRFEEVTYLVDYLEGRAWIEHPHPQLSFYRISVEGYARLAEIEEAATDSSEAFVAMWFDKSMNEVWENAIKRGIEEAGYEAVRIDHKEHVTRSMTRSLRAAGLALPLIAFIGVTFVVPLATMLLRSVYDPAVADALPDTVALLREWDGESDPGEAVYAPPRASCCWRARSGPSVVSPAASTGFVGGCAAFSFGPDAGCWRSGTDRGARC